MTPISKEELETMGMNPDTRKREHLKRVTAIQLGPRVDISSWGKAFAFCNPSPVSRSDFLVTDEDVVKQAARLLLEREGWKITQIRFMSEHGTDIVAERSGERLVVEAKGGIERRGPGIRNYTLTALGQIVLDRVDETWETILAFPALEGYVKSLSKVPPWFWSAMRLKLLLVKKEGETYSIAEVRMRERDDPRRFDSSPSDMP